VTSDCPTNAAVFTSNASENKQRAKANKANNALTTLPDDEIMNFSNASDQATASRKL
jgi:hypothetical protein